MLRTWREQTTWDGREGCLRLPSLPYQDNCHRTGWRGRLLPLPSTGVNESVCEETLMSTTALPHRRLQHCHSQVIERFSSMLKPFTCTLVFHLGVFSQKFHLATREVIIKLPLVRLIWVPSLLPRKIVRTLPFDIQLK